MFDTSSSVRIKYLLKKKSVLKALIPFLPLDVHPARSL